MDLGLQANQPNVELPMNLCVAMILALSLGPRPRVSGRAFGAMTAAAILLKPVAMAQFGLLAVVEFHERWRCESKRSGLVFLRGWTVTTFLVFILVMSWCVGRAGFEPVWEAVVRFNISYVSGTVLGNLVGLIGFGFQLLPSSSVIMGVLGSSAIAGFRVIQAPDRRRILAILGGTAIAVAAPGRFYPHYYQLFLPPLVVAATAGLTYGLGRVGLRRWVSIGAILALVCIEAQSLRFPPEEWSRRKYNEVFLDERRIARAIESLVEPGKPFWQLGVWPGLYLLTGTEPASGVLYAGPLRLESSVRKFLVRRTIFDLSQSMPRLIVTQRHPGDARITGWIAKNYRVLPVEMPARRTSLWIRREPPTPGKRGPRVFSDDFEDGELERWRSRGRGSEWPFR
jgi:hypothetical protein